jgi:hypothetical protein
VNDERNALLAKSDLRMVRDEICHFHALCKEQAAKEGCEVFFKDDYVQAWSAFHDNPTSASALTLLDLAPQLMEIVEKCSPGCESYELTRFLEAHGVSR